MRASPLSFVCVPGVEGVRVCAGPGSGVAVQGMGVGSAGDAVPEWSVVYVTFALPLFLLQSFEGSVYLHAFGTAVLIQTKISDDLRGQTRIQRGENRSLLYPSNTLGEINGVFCL